MTMTKEQLHSLSPFPEREQNRAAYGQLVGDVLNELMGVVVCQQRDGLSDPEVRTLAKSIFEDYVARYLPEIAEQAAAYWESRRAEEHLEQVRQSENEYRRQDRLKAEAAAREKADADRVAAAYSKAGAGNAAQQEELSRIRAQEYREVQERML
jgi:hypothetical protein